jgi:glycosyltransferase involved in cell wall biosynthesis
MHTAVSATVKKRLRVLVLPTARRRPSYRYRVAQLVPGLERAGIDFVQVDMKGKSLWGQFAVALTARHYDYVWIQKRTLAKPVVALLSLATRIVYDYDDALYARETFRVEALKPSQPGAPRQIARLRFILEKASVVFAGTSELATYARTYNDHVHVVPTCPPEVFLDESPVEFPGRIEGPATIGWIGTEENLFYLRSIDEACHAFQREHPEVCFSLMSSEPPEGLTSSWSFEPWSPEAADRWFRSIDVGIMPLIDDTWSRGKCAFKLLQYMSYGKAVIASAVGSNCEAVEHGVNGYLVSSPEEWQQALVQSAADHEKRDAMGREGRRIILERYDLAGVERTILNALGLQARA